MVMANDKHISLLFQEVNVLTLQTRLTDTFCSILFILGIVGNGLGLLTFSSSRRTWRISSVYACLATCSSITNLLCVIRYTSILHSTSRQILRQLVEQTWWACKIYEVSSSLRIISSWITLFWMFERLTCVSRRLRTFFNRWNSFQLKFTIPIIIIIMILSCVVGPPVYMFQPQIIEKNITNLTEKIVIGYCQLHSKAPVKWKKYFHEVHLGMNYATIRCLFSELIPTGTIILFNSYIIYHLIRTYHRLHQTNGQKPKKEQSRTTSWMNAVLILHSALFFFSLFSHIAGHFIILETHETWWILLAVLTNCSLNFYVYCLSGKAFRNEFCRIIHRVKIQIYYKLQSCRDQQQQRSSHSQSSIYEMQHFEVLPIQ